MPRTPEPHTATIAGGPLAGTPVRCFCSRTRDHYLSLGTGEASEHRQPTLF